MMRNRVLWHSPPRSDPFGVRTTADIRLQGFALWPKFPYFVRELRMSVEKLAEKKWVKRLWLDIEIKQIKPEYSIQYTPEGRRAMLLSLDTVKKLIDCDVDETLCEIARIERG